jgi:hypothetical protein
MKPEELKRLLQSRLSQHPLPLDTNSLWLRVEKEYRQKRRRRLILCWSSSMLVLLLAVMGWSWLSSYNKAKPKSPEAKPTASRQLAKLPDRELELSDPLVFTSNPPRVRDSSGIGRAGLSGLQSEKQTDLNLQRPIGADSPTRLQGGARPNPHQQPYHSEMSTPTGKASQASVDQSEVPTLPRPAAELRPGAVAVSLPLLPSRELLLAYPPLLQASADVPLPLLPKKVVWRVLAGVEAGLGKPLRRLDGLVPPLLQRAGNERQLEFMSSGLLVGLSHRSGLTLRTGLLTTRINELATQQLSFTTDTVLNGPTIVFVGADGQDSVVYGPVAVARTVTQNLRYYNRLQWVSVPLLVGYNRHFNRWMAGVEGGVHVQFSPTAAGLLPTLTTPVSYADVVVGQTTVSPHLGLTLGYAMPRWQIVLAPTCIWSPVYKMAGGGLQRHVLPGGQLRVAYVLR